MYAFSPRETMYVIAQAASTEAIVLHVQGRLTGCNPNMDTSEWRVIHDAIVCRVDPANSGRRAEIRIIAAIGSGTIAFQGGLSAAKTLGSYVVLTQRNIEICDAITSTTGQERPLIRYGTGAVIDCALRRFLTGYQFYGIADGTSHTVQGSAVISGCNTGTSFNASSIIQGSAVVGG